MYKAVQKAVGCAYPVSDEYEEIIECFVKLAARLLDASVPVGHTEVRQVDYSLQWYYDGYSRRL